MRFPSYPSMFSRRRMLLPTLGAFLLASAAPPTPATAAPLPGAQTTAVSRVEPPDRNQPYYYLYYFGMADYGLGRYADAITDFKQFIDRADTSDLGDVFLYLAASYNETGQYAQAIPAFTTHMLSHPEDTSNYALAGRGYAYSMLKNYDAAVADYEAFLLVAPKVSRACVNSHASKRNTAKPSDNGVSNILAEANPKCGGGTVEPLLQVSPAPPSVDNSDPKKMLKSYINNKDFAGVISATTAFIAQFPNEPQNYFIRGTVYEAMKKFDMAIPDLVKYTGMKPNDAMGFFNLGVAYSGKMDNVNAAPTFEKAFTLKPDNYDAANAAAAAYMRLADADKADPEKSERERDKALELYDKASKIPSASPKQRADALYNEAAALEEKAKTTMSSAPLQLSDR